MKQKSLHTGILIGKWLSTMLLSIMIFLLLVIALFIEGGDGLGTKTFFIIVAIKLILLGIACICYAGIRRIWPGKLEPLFQSKNAIC